MDNEDDNDNKNKDTYEVGYKKPPKGRQFGAKNGNPRNKKGRAKVNRTLEEEVRNILNEKMTVQKDGRQEKMTKREVLITRIFTGAINGDKAMMRFAIPLLKLADNAPDFQVLPEDEEVLKQLQDLMEPLEVSEDDKN